MKKIFLQPVVKKQEVVVGNAYAGMGVLIVNACVTYVAVNVCIWKKQKKNLPTQYNFRK